MLVLTQNSCCISSGTTLITGLRSSGSFSNLSPHPASPPKYRLTVLSLRAPQYSPIGTPPFFFCLDLHTTVNWGLISSCTDCLTTQSLALLLLQPSIVRAPQVVFHILFNTSLADFVAPSIKIKPSHIPSRKTALVNQVNRRSCAIDSKVRILIVHITY